MNNYYNWILWICILLIPLISLSVFSQEISNVSVKKLYGYEFPQQYGVLSQVVPNSINPQNTLNTAVEKSSSISNISANNFEESDYDFYSHTYGGMNIPNASIVDDNGNIYITGGSSNPDEPGGDFTTIKVNSQGDKIWEKRQLGTKYAANQGMAITLNDDGDIIAAGTHWNGNDMDIQIVKYNAETGDVSWENTFDGGHGGLDVPKTITTDESGNTILSGITYTGNNVAYLILKYDSEGSLLWSATANNPSEDTFNEPSALTVDNEGNIIITGYGGNENYFQSYYTLKYSPAGEELWAQLYNYESEEGNETNSTARGIAYDEDDNYYVTGIFNTNNPEIGTIKYNSEGEQQWIKTYKYENDFTNGFAVEVAADGSIYIAGSHYGSYSDDGIVLISYDSDGNENWLAVSHDIIQNTDAVQMVLNTDDEPVLATFGEIQGNNTWGYNDHQIKMHHYNQNGDLLHESTYLKPHSDNAGFKNITGIGLDSEANIYVIVKSFYTEYGGVYEYLKMSLGTDSDTPEWNEKFSNENRRRTRMNSAISDKNSNTYVISDFGSYAEGEYIQNFVLTKYNENGNVVWEKVYNTLEEGEYPSVQVKIDTDDNIILAFVPSSVVEDPGPLKLKRLTPDGDLIWETEKEIFSPKLETFFMDESNNIYLAGSARENPLDPYPNFFTIKYSDSGNEEWANFDDSGSDEDHEFHINAGTVNSNGEIILTGYYGVVTMLAENINIAALKYDSDGDLIWLNTVEVDSETASGLNVSVDENDGIYIAGVLMDIVSNKSNMITAKLDSSGETLWTSIYEDADRQIRPYEVHKLSSGNILVSASSTMLNHNNKIVLAEYDDEGNEVSIRSSELQHFYVGMYIDDSDKVYILTQIQPSVIPYRINYSSSAIPSASLWIIDPDTGEEYEDFDTPSLAQYFPVSLVALGNETLLVAGYISHELDYFQGLYFFQSEHEILGVEEHDPDKQNQNLLGQNYPNPFSASSTIPFDLKEGGKVTIRLFDIQGRELQTLVNEQFSAGKHSITIDKSNLKTGIYLYQMQVGRYKESRKMMVK